MLKGYKIISNRMNIMKTASLLGLLSLLFFISSSFIIDNDAIAKAELNGPCDCEKGWNFIVHQVTPQGCRQKSIYCTEGVKLEPGYTCGTCPKPCSTCEEDEDGNISMCRVYGNGRTSDYKANCDNLQDFFKENGDFKNKKDHCGPCDCADENDIDTDGDGICDKKDECPNDAERSEAGLCGCDDIDTDGDGICDKKDECPNDAERSEAGLCGCDDVDTDGDGICDADENEVGELCDVSGNNTFEWIESVKINKFYKKSGANSNGYGNYSSDNITLSAGDVLSVWLNVGHTDNVCEISHAIFVDWNQDGDLNDPGEMILNERGMGEKGIDYQLADDIATGSYAMRVIIDLGRVYGACGGCIDGEVEDYMITIAESSCLNVYEGFNYKADKAIKNKNGGKNWANGWKVTSEGIAVANVVTKSIASTKYETNGNKLGVLLQPGSSLTISRDLSNTIFQKSGEVWMSFSYQYDIYSVFSPQINGKSIGFYVDRKGYLVIGGLKGIKLKDNETYTFLIRTKLNAGADEITIWVNPSDLEPLYHQTYNSEILGHFASIGFEFWAAGTNNNNVAQYIDEIRVACSQDEVLPISDAGDLSGLNTAVALQLTVYPNPMLSGSPIVITLSGSEVMIHDYIIFDGSGRMMYSGVLYIGENEIILPALESGIYFIEINTSEGLIKQQLVVQND